MTRVIRWSEAQPPSTQQLQRRMAAEGLSPYSWSNAPGERYPVHSHSYHKLIYVVEGSIRFGIPQQGQTLELQPGDRLELPAGLAHDALVGPQGVTCLEAHTDDFTPA